MANLNVKDGAAASKYLKGSGAGTDVDPFLGDHTDLTKDVLIGAVNETAPSTDTASSGLNGRLQRLAQRITSLIALLPTALGTGGGLKVDGSGTALPVSGSVNATVSGVAQDTSVTNPQVTAGTTAPTKIDIIGGKSNDATPQYQPLPLNPSGLTVAVDELFPTADLDITQKITVTTAGTPVTGPNKTNPGGWFLTPDASDTGVCYWMYTGQTAANKGVPMAVGTVLFVKVSTLNSLDFDAATSGNTIKAWKA